MAEPIRDVARLQSQLAAIVASSDDAIVSKTLEGIIETWNQGAERIFGYTADEVIGQPINIIIPDDRQHEEPEILRRIRSGLRVDHFETIRRRKDGRLIDISVTISPVRDSTGTIVGASKIARDISSQKRIQRELEAAKAAAEEANRAKDQFLSVLSHELRTPLTPALASLSYLESQSQLNEEVRAQVGMARRNVEAEARLVDDLLDLTRIARGKMSLHFEVIDLHAALRAAVATVQRELDEKALEVSLALRARPYEVWADSGRLQQVFLNLLTNAIKFTPNGGAIAVRTSGGSGNGDNGNGGNRIRIQISDTGSGIDPQMLERLFAPFEQASSARRFGGLGLGLSITRSLIEMHRGTINAASEGLDRGATFTLELPLLERPAAAAASRALDGAPQSSPQELRRAAFQRCRILLVEDHADTRQIMSKVLRSLGCDVTTAGGVREALSLAERSDFDLLVSDIGLSDGTGMDVMRALRDRPGIHGIAISGYGHEDDLRRSREAGFNEHLVKPINFKALQEAVTRAVGNS
jgi:PAS domain S-box-containing protein